MRNKWTGLITIWLLIFTAFSHAAGKAVLLDIKGTINPATQDYVQRGISVANQEQAAIVILQIDTPGGLDSAMRGINKAILNSAVPIITYVAPTGARAASAGTFILYASQIAAMAPGTNVGAASPINLFNEDKNLSTEKKKVVNDAAAYIRSLAQLRGRNVEWAESAVRQGASISAEEAKKTNVINVIAKDYPDLLQQINAQKVTVVGGAIKAIQTKDLQIEQRDPDWRYDLLSFITNPNVAYLLMLVAMYGLFFEFSNPGLVLPGVAGIIALLLVLYAFQLMPINYTGLALIIVGIGFMIAELYISSFGALGIGGVIAFLLGSIMLFDVNDPNYRLAYWLIILMSLLTITFFFLILNLAFRSQKRAIVTGQEGLIGHEGIVISVNEQIIARILGELWEVQAAVPLQEGQKVKVVKIKGLKLLVEPVIKT